MTRWVGVFGGSFDPVHEAHLIVCRRALKQVPLDEVWLLPARRAPLRSAAPLAPAEHRVAMLELAIAGEKRFSVCRHELDRAEEQRSVETMEQLHSAHPDLRFRFLMGEDSFRSLHRWRDPERLAELAPFVVQPRPPADENRPPTYAGQPVFWLQGDPVSLSSTKLRRALLGDGDVEGLVPSVLDYVRRHRLYGRGGSEGAR